MDALKSVSSFTNAIAPSPLPRLHLPSRPFAASTVSFLKPPSHPPAAAAPAPAPAPHKLRSGVPAPLLVHLFVLQHKRNWSISSSPSSLSPESQVHVETLGSQPQAEQGTKTVHVKFLLERACSYGETFLLSGDDPIFGLWNPSEAIPLNWSEGHVWSIELDLPVGRTIQYKFILKCNDGEMKWQPGPDRILKTWETKNTVVLSEDWRFASLQKITEVEAESGEKNKSVFQEVEAGSNISMGLSSDHQQPEMKGGEVVNTRGEVLAKEEVSTVVVADACVGERDED